LACTTLSHLRSSGRASKYASVRSREARLVADPVGETHAREFGGQVRMRFVRPDSVQSAVTDEVLFNAEIRIEGALLKHDAEQRKGGAAVARDVMAEDPDCARPTRIEVGVLSA
jgi:hypothetical protein